MLFHQEADSVVPPYFEKSHFPVDNHILSSCVAAVLLHEKRKYDSCEVIIIFSCFILSRLGVGVETKTTKDQVWQVDFSATALLFTVDILLDNEYFIFHLSCDTLSSLDNASLFTYLPVFKVDHTVLVGITSTHTHLKLNYFGILSYFTGG